MKLPTQPLSWLLKFAFAKPIQPPSQFLGEVLGTCMGMGGVLLLTGSQNEDGKVLASHAGAAVVTLIGVASNTVNACIRAGMQHVPSS